MGLELFSKAFSPTLFRKNQVNDEEANQTYLKIKKRALVNQE